MIGKYIAFGLVGAVIGYGYAIPKTEFWSQDVQIYGGVTMSTPVADVWGYADDWEGCLTLAAGANIVNQKELEMTSDAWREFISKWAKNGNTSCQRHR